MIADMVADAALASWWAPALAFAAGVVSFASPCVCRWCPATSRSSPGAALREGEGRPPARADPAVHRRVHDRVHAARRVRLDLRRGLRGRRASGSAGRVVHRARRADDRLRVRPRLARGCTRSGGRSSRGCGRARPGRCRSGWRSPPGGRRASGRCSGRSSRSRRAGSTSRARRCWSCYSLGLGVPFLLGRARGRQRLVGASGGCKRHYTGDRGRVGSAAGRRRGAAGHGRVHAIVRAARARFAPGL